MIMSMQAYGMEVLHWVLVCITGLLTSLVATLFDICVHELIRLKYSLFGTG